MSKLFISDRYFVINQSASPLDVFRILLECEIDDEAFCFSKRRVNHQSDDLINLVKLKLFTFSESFQDLVLKISHPLEQSGALGFLRLLNLFFSLLSFLITHDRVTILIDFS